MHMILHTVIFQPLIQIIHGVMVIIVDMHMHCNSLASLNSSSKRLDSWYFRKIQ